MVPARQTAHLTTNHVAGAELPMLVVRTFVVAQDSISAGTDVDGVHWPPHVHIFVE
jgi:hypothetical protein